MLRAQRYCATAERCRQQVVAKLQLWGANEEQINGVVDSLIADSYLNEQRFAIAFVHDKVTYQGWGRIKIRVMLQALAIDNTLIDEAMSHIDEQTYFHNLTKAAALKKAADRDKRIRFLMQRGYTLADIRCLEDKGGDF